MSADASMSAAIRVGDHLALDFLNTVASPQGEPVEWIGDGRDLVAWLTGAGVLSAVDGARLIDLNSTELLDAVARDARALRERFRDLVVKLKGKAPLDAASVERLNAILTRHPAHLRLASSLRGAKLTSERSWREPGELLAPIAEAMADLIAHGDFSLVRKCENPPCTLWFYDRTKGHKRRWCSQAMCGNRAKVAAFRARQKK